MTDTTTNIHQQHRCLIFTIEALKQVLLNGVKVLVHPRGPAERVRPHVRVELGAHGRVGRVVAQLEEVLGGVEGELGVAVGDGGRGGEVGGFEVGGEGGDAAEDTAGVTWSGAVSRQSIYALSHSQQQNGKGRGEEEEEEETHNKG